MECSLRLQDTVLIIGSSQLGYYVNNGTIERTMSHNDTFGSSSILQDTSPAGYA